MPYRSLKLLLLMLVVGCGLGARRLAGEAGAAGRVRVPSLQRCARVLVFEGEHPAEGLHCPAPGPRALSAWAERVGLGRCAVPTADVERVLLGEDPDGGCRLFGGEVPAAARGALELPLDLNSATAKALESLPGIGPVTARRITDDRRRRGPFPNVDALERVRGVGPRTVGRVRRLLRAEGER